MKETTFAQQSEKYYADAQNYVVKLQTSPQVIRYQTSFTDYLGKQIEKYQFVGEKILKQVRKKFIAFEHSAEMGEDLKWFSKQVSMQHLDSPFFFEKYLVIGCSLETLEEDVSNSPEKSRLMKRLAPSILL